MMGRWRSGAPLALCPVHDDPELGADPHATTTSCIGDDDPAGFKTPAARTSGASTRAMRPSRAWPGCTA